ncbi:MAG TPA: hypothetical protein VEP90_22300, partial [Methylomirabilota bacterium]|nr:hypothetical protein [Methylomirabilota bacterium]
MFKKLSAFIFALTSFIVFPALAFANGGTFTASSYSYNVGSHHLSFHANSFSPDNSGWWRYGLCTIPVSGQNALTDDTHCAYTDGIQLTGNDLNVSVTLTHGLMSLNPGNVYIVMEDYDTGQEWVSQQITNMWDPYGSFTASSYSYDTNSHQLSFHANSFSPDNANWWRYGICNVSIGGQNNLTDDTHCAYTD